MTSTQFRYTTKGIWGDYARAAVGIVLTGIPLVIASPGFWATLILGGLAALFVIFALRTGMRHATVVELTPEAVSTVAPRRATLRWQDLERLRLNYFTTRRDRRGGWMQLRVDGGGQRLSFDSDLDGFDAIVRAAAEAGGRRQLAYNEATVANLTALGLDEAAGAHRSNR